MTQAAIAALDAGGVVAFPTETVYGIGCRLNSSKGVERMFRAKGRSRDMPFQVLLASVDEVGRWGDLGADGTALAAALMPGPLTLVCRSLVELPDLGGRPGTVGMRVPDHPLAKRLLRACGPLCASSANRSGSRTPATIGGVREIFGEEIDAYADEPPRPSGEASTLVDLTGTAPVVLRHGVVSEARIAEVLAF